MPNQLKPLDIHNEGDLRVWHIPQVPGDAFHVQVFDPCEAVMILHVLAQYDLFQLQHNIKGDYCNAAGLEIFQDGQWVEWADDDEGLDIDEYAETINASRVIS